ncbi:MAG: LacI family DNA-binding transcriptional regulator [Candidatus Limiplasma sp.]|nr:LacI family DNA-binding transcriptional regulator [Candidatus Limiplasma sp.]
MNKKTVGIREIAKLSGVSVASVSRVINSPEKTSESIRRRVNEVIRAYNYVPNMNAKNLFSKTSNAFALFIYDMENPYFTALIKEMGQVALRNKCSLLICDTQNDPVLEAEYLRYCEAIHTHGIILTEGFNRGMDNFRRTTQRLIGLDRDIGGNHPCIHSDNAKGVHLLMDSLFNLNHRAIAFAGYVPSFRSCEERYGAFLNAIKDRGLELPPEYVFNGSLDATTGARAMDYFCSLRNPPTAILCANDPVAMGLCMRASQLGFGIPGDFSVVGFDGCMPGYAYPRLTTIRQDISQLSQALFDALFSEDAPLDQVIDVSLVIGDSCRKI